MNTSKRRASDGGKGDETAVFAESISNLHPLKKYGLYYGLAVDAEGKVASVSEYESRFPDPAVSSCALEGLRGAVLPRANGVPGRLIWALRLGTPPAPEGGLGRPGSVSTLAEPKRTVAEAVPPRVPVAK